MLPKTIDATKGVKGDDIIIAFMGATGSGKSFFIDLLTEQTGRRAGNSLTSVTQGIEATRMQLPGDPKERDIVLVDTPGFDGTATSDMEVLQMINKWLQKTYERNIRLSALVYLHRITDNRMGSSPCKNVRMFGELCGELVMTKVVLVTTMWEKVPLQVGEEREKELISIYWKGLIERGSSVDRLKRGTYNDAWAVVSQMLERRLRREASEIVLLHEERLIDNHPSTAKYTDLRKQMLQQQKSIKSLLVKIDKTKDQPQKRKLETELEVLKRKLYQTNREAEELKLSIFKRIFSFIYTLIPAKARAAMKQRRATS